MSETTDFTRTIRCPMCDAVLNFASTVSKDDERKIWGDHLDTHKKKPAKANLPDSERCASGR